MVNKLIKLIHVVTTAESGIVNPIIIEDIITGNNCKLFS